MIGELLLISLPYGNLTIDMQVPANNLLAVVGPREVASAPDLGNQLRSVLRDPVNLPPFPELLKKGDSLLLLIDDLTRPTPVARILPLLLEQLGVERKKVEVTILIALGTHRRMSSAEIRAKVGPEIHSAYPVVNHEWDDKGALIDLGTTANGTPIRVNRMLEACDVCLGIGNIVPHNLAGWSGGGKIVQPGICGKETTYRTHLLAARCPTSNLGKVWNPVRTEIEEVASQTRLTGVVNTVLDRHGSPVHVVAGAARATYEQGVQLARSVWEVPVPRLADIVIVSSYPADIDFWQANKGLFAAERVVKRGGDIILVTPCPERLSSQEEHAAALAALAGIPSRSLFHEARQRGVDDYAALCVSDIAARSRELAWVSVVSDGLTESDVGILGLARANSIEDALSVALARQGQEAGIVVLTHGGEILPVVGQT
jgi:nickel-dependent lactate racemase